MKILMLGYLTAKYIQENWVRTIDNLYDVTFIDHSMLSNIKHNDFRYIEKYIYSIIREKEYDFLFVYTDGIHNHLDDNFYNTIRKTGIKVIAYHADDEPNVWYRKNSLYDHRFDIIASHSKRATEMRKNKGYDERALYLPWAFSPELYYKKNMEKKYDVVHLGWNKFIDGKYIEDGEQRQRILVEIYRFCKENNINFKLFGFGWDKHPILKECYEGKVGFTEINDIYNSSKMVFNPGYSPEGLYQTKLRHFEVAGSGAFQITNYNPEIEEIFGDSIEFYRNNEELYEKVLFYLDNDSIRENKAEKMYDIAISHNKIEDRLVKLFEHSNKLYPVIKSNEYRKLKVKQIKIKSIDNICNYEISDLISSCYDYDLIHFLIGDFKINNINYSNLNREIIFKSEYSIFNINTFVEFGSEGNTDNQRGHLSILGSLLNEKLRTEPVLNNKLLSLKSANAYEPIINYLVRPNKALELLDIFTNKKNKLFDCLEVFRTQKIVNDISVEIEDEKMLNKLSYPYLEKLKKFCELNKCKRLSAVLYGARGNMAKKTINFLQNYSNIEIIGCVDNNLDAQYLSYRIKKLKKDKEYKILKNNDLKNIDVDVIIIAAATSGPAIYEDIKEMEFNTLILPLYDINDPIWDYVNE